MNTINKNILKALFESQSPYSAEFKKTAKELAESIADCDFKKPKDVEYLIDDILQDYAEDYITDYADEVYKYYTFHTQDDSDYDREYGYGTYITLQIDDAEINSKALKDLQKELLEGLDEFIHDEKYKEFFTPEIIKKFDDNKEVLEKALPKELEEYYTDSYIETYMDNIDIRSDSRVN
jgi:hypothetical protein